MVRGIQSCAGFCAHCRVDCRCDGCRVCHSCDPYSSAQHYCEHDCQTVAQRSLAPEPVPTVVSQSDLMQDIPRLFGSDLVEVILGADQNKISRRLLPKDALIQNSDYFKTAFAFNEKATIGGNQAVDDRSDVGNRPTNDTNPGIVTIKVLRINLNEQVDDPKAFDKFIQYVYLRDYHPPSSEDHAMDIRMHADVYVLAERLIADGLKNKAMQKATEICVRLSKCAKLQTPTSQTLMCLGFIPGVVEKVYDNTPAGVSENTQSSDSSSGLHVSKDPFRSLLAAFCASCLNRMKTVPGFSECLLGLPEFAVDLVANVSEGSALQGN